MLLLVKTATPGNIKSDFLSKLSGKFSLLFHLFQYNSPQVTILRVRVEGK